MKFRLVAAVCLLLLSQLGRMAAQAEADAQFTNSPLTNQLLQVKMMMIMMIITIIIIIMMIHLLQDGHFLPHGHGVHNIHNFLPPLPQDPLLFDPLINDPFHPIAPNSLAAASAAHAATHGLPVGPSIHAVISHGSCR